MHEVDELLAWFEQNRNETSCAGMSRFGINVDKAYGISMPLLRAEAKKYRRRQDIAEELWRTEIHEARIMAGLVADPREVTPVLMDEWVMGFDSWDVCDQCCLNLFRKVPFVHDKIMKYAASEAEFVRRTSFVLIATLAVHSKELPDESFIPYLKLIEVYASDDRNFVRKAVNWALRQIGKRNMSLNAMGIDVARRLSECDDASSRWVGRDALRELSAEKTRAFIEAHRGK